MKNNTKQSGFTIIEVVLVLAIAGLIFLMVFIALPALQRSQRDTQRKNDLSRAITKVNDFTGNNRGNLPVNTNAAWATFLTQYLTPTASDSFVDPLGAPTGVGAGAGAGSNTYVFQANTTLAAPVAGATFNSTTQNVIYFSSSYECTNGGAIQAAGNRKVALRMYLEGGGVACQNN